MRTQLNFAALRQVSAAMFATDLLRVSFARPWCSPRNTVLVTAADRFSRTWGVPG